MSAKPIIHRINLFIMSLAAALLLAAPLSSAQASAASPSVKQAQSILAKYRIPVGSADGVFGPQTARGFCAYRYIAGMTTSRANVTTSFMSSLKSFNGKYASLGQVPAPTKGGRSTYVVVEKKCQALFYVQNGRYSAVVPVSTGMAGHNTPNGSYTLGSTQRGWSCSTAYPESCNDQTNGRFASVSKYGNMYNKRYFRSGGYYIHGSNSVPTYPASHGCIRVTVAVADWMYDHIGNNGAPALYVVNEY